MNKFLRKFQKLPQIKKTTAFIKTNKKRVIIFIVIAIIAIYVIKKVTSLPKGLETTTVEKKDLTEEVSANGSVKAKSYADLKFNSPSKVSWVGVKEGDHVWRGQAVASLDAVVLNTVYEQAKADYRNYQATAEKVLDDVKDHDKDETFTQKAERTTAEVNRDKAYDAMIAAQHNLANAALISPITGTVIDTNDLVAGLNLTGADLESKFIRVVDLPSIYFSADIDEVDFGKVKLDQEAKVTFDAYPNEVCLGKVNSIDNEGKKTSGGVVIITAEVALNDCNLDLVLDLNGQANIVISKLQEVISIPKKYLVNQNGKDYVWLMTGETPRKRKLVAVETGASSSTSIEIKSGISEGDTIIYIPSK